MDVNIKDMLQAKVHYGHHRRFSNPIMKPYIMTSKHKLQIFDLYKTKLHLQNCANVISDLINAKGSILIVGTKQAAKEEVERFSSELGLFYVTKRWLGGTLTNRSIMLDNIRNFSKIKKNFKIISSKLTNKESIKLQHKLHKKESLLKGILDMKTTPDMIFVIDVNRDHIAIKEARKLGIKIMAVVDSNASYYDLDYFIPGNDDSKQAIKFYLETILNNVRKNQATER